MWKRNTSNPAVFSYVSLSQFTELGWQTKPQLYVDANESRHIARLSVLRLAEVLCVLSASDGSPEAKCKCSAQAECSSKHNLICEVCALRKMNRMLYLL